MTWCVYALTGSAARVSAVGLSGERLHLVREGPLGAIVGQPSRPPRPLPENLRRYDRIIRTLSSRLPAVLPARFGTCFGDLDELRFVLRSRRPSFSQALAHVRHRVQMTVRIIEPPRAGPPEGDPHITDSSGPPDGPPAGGPSRTDVPVGAAFRRPMKSGTAYLRARADRAAREREVSGFDPVRQAVQRWVRDERVEKRERVATVYHLVPRASADAYRRAIDRAATAARLRVIVSGPWPAYAFVDGW